MAAATTGPSGDITAPLSDDKKEFAPTQHLEGGEDGSEAEEGAPSEEALGAAGALVSSDSGEAKKWTGWPGLSVFRLIVPLLKVGSIIGRKGEFIKKLCEETRARVRILEGAIGTNERIVLISAREEKDTEISPAMDAALRVFKRVYEMSESTGDEQVPAATSVRLLVASYQAINLIGKQGTVIKSIQESTSATIRVLSDELPYCATADERIIEISGEYQKVLKALEAVVGHLRKFLVDRSVLPLFEKTMKMPAAQDLEPNAWGEKSVASANSSLTGIVNGYGFPANQDSLYRDRESHLDSQLQYSSLSLYGRDPALSGLGRDPALSGLGRDHSAAALVTQVTQTMQIPLSYAEDIIGIGGGNIAYIRRTSGAVLTVQETRGVPDEITVEIKGNPSEVQKAQQIIQDLLAGHKDPAPSSYGSLDTGLGSSYSHFGSSGYSSSLSASSLGGFGSSGLGGYGSYRF
ncbi:RNA-binding KH domain-containing protein PEPPER-like isoform X2 [Phalaenopsis equestris]|uniref:RNA-binding KH domain-containing protein PEPPER-like isoform X2 n=1 Tax=Phalaenopsis equestris TaxID=78828 RepID=UPI0009E41311|nr:RNA-binding KH domain-containing protein PEPPER-like isoform X2 [Phalaenopsis equestris]